MSKLTLPSVSDSFNASSNVPRNPDGPDWKKMAFQLFLVVAGSVTFGLIISSSNKKLSNRIMAGNEEMFKRLQEANNRKFTATNGSDNPKPNPTRVSTDNADAGDINKT